MHSLISAISDDATDAPPAADRPRFGSYSSCEGECNGCIAAATGIPLEDSDYSTDDTSSYGFYSPQLPFSLPGVTEQALLEEQITMDLLATSLKNGLNMNNRQLITSEPINIRSIYSSSSAPLDHRRSAALDRLPAPIRATSTITIYQTLNQNNPPAIEGYFSDNNSGDENDNVESNIETSSRVSPVSSSPTDSVNNFETTSEESAEDSVVKEAVYSYDPNALMFELHDDEDENTVENDKIFIEPYTPQSIKRGF